MKTRYDIFKRNEWETWRFRFTWRGLYGDKIYPKINIFMFFKNTGAHEKLREIRNVNKYFSEVNKMADSYVKWVEKKESHTEEELLDLKTFFVGCIGEFFFGNLFNEVKSIECVEQNAAHRYDFNYVCPLLKGENDFGIDLTGLVSDKDGDRNCVFQIKFWNPFAEPKISMTIAQKAFSEGITNGFIDPKEKHNVVICWLGDEEDNVTRCLKTNKNLYEHVIFVGKKSLNLTINDRNGVFWDGIVDKLNDYLRNLN